MPERLHRDLGDGLLMRTVRSDARDIRLPPLPAVQLLTGYRSREEISCYRLDLGVRDKFQLIVDTLFPKRESYVYRAL